MENFDFSYNFHSIPHFTFSKISLLLRSSAWPPPPVFMIECFAGGGGGDEWVLCVCCAISLVGWMMPFVKNDFGRKNNHAIDNGTPNNNERQNPRKIMMMLRRGKKMHDICPDPGKVQPKVGKHRVLASSCGWHTPHSLSHQSIHTTLGGIFLAFSSLFLSLWPFPLPSLCVPIGCCWICVRLFHWICSAGRCLISVFCFLSSGRWGGK